MCPTLALLQALRPRSMACMRPGLRTILILIAALLLRGLSSAYALPMPGGGMGAAHGVTHQQHDDAAHAAHHAADDEACCGEHDDQAVGHAAQNEHGSSICKMACDLGAAPALMPPPVTLPSLPPVAHVATIAQFSIGLDLSPDHPPPRR